MKRVYGFMVLLAAFGGSPAGAGVAPFTETFQSGPANWFNSAGTAVVDWSATGGVENGFAQATFNFVQTAPEATPVLFRAHDEFGSSGGAFVGDWVSAGITEFSAFVMHDGPAPLNFFARFAGPANSPGAAQVFVIPVQPNTWTQLSVDLPSPSMIFEGPFTFAQVFGNIGHVQIGVAAAGVAGLDQNIHFGLDNVSMVPEPATAALLLGGLAVAMHRRRVRGKTR